MRKVALFAMVLLGNSVAQEPKAFEEYQDFTIAKYLELTSADLRRYFGQKTRHLPPIEIVSYQSLSSPASSIPIPECVQPIFTFVSARRIGDEKEFE